jgi:hypothetical protein
LSVYPPLFLDRHLFLHFSFPPRDPVALNPFRLRLNLLNDLTWPSEPFRTRPAVNLESPRRCGPYLLFVPSISSVPCLPPFRTRVSRIRPGFSSSSSQPIHHQNQSLEPVNFRASLHWACRFMLGPESCV